MHADPHGAVLKPATDGGSVGLLLLSGAGSFPNGSLLFRTDRSGEAVLLFRSEAVAKRLRQ